MGAFSRTLLVGSLAAGLVACSTVKDGAVAGYDLDFFKQKYTEQSLEVNGRNMRFRAYESIVCVGNPAGTKYEVINIYVPKVYYNDGSTGGFTAETAPILFLSQISGYMPAELGKPGLGRGGEASQTPNAALTALSKGYVVASPSVRGRTAANGKAPAAIVDLKAMVHYLKFNDKATLGDTGRIIPNGTSAGGAPSVLLGTTDNSRDYEAHFKTLDMAGGGDNIFAVSAYCSITDLDHADVACGWQFNGVDGYQKMNASVLDRNVKRRLVPGTPAKEEISLSSQLRPLYPTYTNSLKLKDTGGHALTLDRNGNDSSKDYIAGYLAKSTQSQLDAGKKLGNRDWLTVKNGRVTTVGSSKYAKVTGRQGTPPAFDDVDLSTGENQLFGNTQTDKRYSAEFSMRYSTAENTAMADTETIKVMSPLSYIGAPRVKIPQNWRIRVSTADCDTSLIVSVALAAKL